MIYFNGRHENSCRSFKTEERAGGTSSVHRADNRMFTYIRKLAQMKIIE